MQTDTPLRQTPGILYWEDPSDDGALVVKPPHDTKHLNATGKLIWNLVDGNRRRADILQALQAEFEDVPPETLAEDLEAFLEDLIADGFLQTVPPEENEGFQAPG